MKTKAGTSAFRARPQAIHVENCPCDPCAAVRAKNRPPAAIGYARVSTDEQETRQQLDALKAAGCTDEHIFDEPAISGTSTSRPRLDECLALLKPGDTFIVWKLDRLGRRMLHVVTTIQDLNARGIAFRSLTENIDTTNAAGRFMLHVFASLAELERDVTVERIKATLGAKKRRGEKVGGRYFQISRAQVEDAKALLAGGRSQKDVAGTLGVSRATLHRALERSELEATDARVRSALDVSQPERRPKAIA
jgi:DNA invertase Pin-like site-specific DNA recombinase